MEFEFDKQLTPQNAIEIDNIGSFALEAISETGNYYYYIVQTLMGQSVIASCGPIAPDIYEIPSGFNVSLYRIEYNETKLIKGIDLFLNDKYKKILYAKEIDTEDAIEQVRDIKEYLRSVSKGGF